MQHRCSSIACTEDALHAGPSDFVRVGMDLADRCTEGVDIFRSTRYSFAINFGRGGGHAPCHRACGVWWPMMGFDSS